MKKTLCIYHDYIPYIGGIETAIYNLAKRLKEHYEITIVFRNAQSPLSVIKYSQNANVIKLSSIEKTLHFDFLLIGSNHLKPKELEGSKVLQWVHSDYSKYNIDLVQNKIDEYISVSKSAGEVFTKLF
ncbi:MAG: hypothetical protein EOM19_06515, partial [Candidatus Moranbacteria bacterium]|nr:hypothetical protein [Candidatus Moranbacteria bacterium]